MGRGLFGTLAAGARDLEHKSADMAALTWEALMGAPAKSGVAVNIDSALKVTTVLACCRVLAEGIAQIPLKVGRESAGGSFKPAVDHPAYRVLYRRPNDWMTSFELRETMMFHACLAGNAYAFKNKLRGQLRELIPLVPGSVCVIKQPDWSLLYQVSDPDGRVVGLFDRSQIFHLRGPSWDSQIGLDAMRLAREAIGLSIATEETHAKLHANGAQPGGILGFDKMLSPEATAKLKANFAAHHEGVRNAFQTLVLDNGAKWTPMAMTGVDAQHLETRRFQIEEICRALRVLPIMIGYYDKAATYASSEQMFIAHLVHHVMPWVERWQQAIDVQLLDDDEALTARFNVRGLLRGDAASMAAYYASGIANGWLARNEARVEEGLDPLPGLDEPLVPLNMGTSADQATIAGKVVSAVKSFLVIDGGKSLPDDQIEALELKIGRVLSSANEGRIRSAHAELERVLASLPKAA